MPRGEGSGWHRQSRRHSEAAKGSRPTHAKASKPKSPDAKFQRTYAQAFQDFERRDLARNEEELQDIYDNDPDNDAQVELIDQIWEGRARIELAEIMKGLADRGLTNSQYITALKKFQTKASDEAERIWEKQEEMESGEYNEDEYEKLDHRRHKLEWQAGAVHWITDNIRSGQPFRAG
jgi:predicted Zn-dependent protease